MPTYTLTLTDEQDAAMTARRLIDAPETKDNATYMAAAVHETVVDATMQAFIERRVQRVADAYRAGTAAQRAAVDQVLAVRG